MGWEDATDAKLTDQAKIY